MRSAAAPTGRAVDRVATGLHQAGGRVGDGLGNARGAGLPRTTLVSRVFTDDHFVVVQRQHPHVDVPGGVVTLRKRVGQGDVEAFVLGEVVGDLKFAQRRVFINDQARHVGVACAEQVKIAAAVDQRNVVHRLAQLGAEYARKQVVIGTRT